MTEFVGSTFVEGAKLEYFLSEEEGKYSVGVTKTTTEREWGRIPGGYEDAKACCRALLRGQVFPSTLPGLPEHAAGSPCRLGGGAMHRKKGLTNGTGFFIIILENKNDSDF